MSADCPHRDNSGVLFVNHKRHSPKSPAFDGECTVAGVRYRIAAWEKQGKFDKFYSLAFSLPQAPKSPKAPTPASERQGER